MLLMAQKTWQMPDTLILIFIVGILATILTYFIPAGHFDSQQVTYLVDGAEKSRTVIDSLTHSNMRLMKMVIWSISQSGYSHRVAALV